MTKDMNVDVSFKVNDEGNGTVMLEALAMDETLYLIYSQVTRLELIQRFATRS
jgi:hypothetical protein